MSTKNDKNLSIIRQSFAHTILSHKVQELASKDKKKRSIAIKTINIILVLLVLMILFMQMLHLSLYISGDNLFYIATIITIIHTIFLITQLYFRYEEKSIEHKNSAIQYMDLRDNYQSLITDIIDKSIKEKEIMERRDELQKEYRIITDLAPQTTQKEYIQAQKILNRQNPLTEEDFTWEDQEIDNFLPKELRMIQPEDSV